MLDFLTDLWTNTLRIKYDHLATKFACNADTNDLWLSRSPVGICSTPRETAINDTYMTVSDAPTQLRTDVDAEVSSPSVLSTEDIYEILSNRRRRYAIHYLKQVDEPVDVSTLAEQVAAWENGKSVEELTSQERKRVYISLYQSHLPTLGKRGLIVYDEDRGVVELTDPVANAQIYLEVVAGRNVPWSYFYLGLSVVSGLLVVLTYYQVGVLEEISAAAIGGVITLLFATSAIAQTVQTGRMQLGDDGPPPELRREYTED